MEPRVLYPILPSGTRLENQWLFQNVSGMTLKLVTANRLAPPTESVVEEGVPNKLELDNNVDLQVPFEAGSSTRSQLVNS